MDGEVERVSDPARLVRPAREKGERERTFLKSQTATPATTMMPTTAPATMPMTLPVPRLDEPLEPLSPAEDAVGSALDDDDEAAEPETMTMVVEVASEVARATTVEDELCEGGRGGESARLLALARTAARRARDAPRSSPTRSSQELCGCKERASVFVLVESSRGLLLRLEADNVAAGCSQPTRPPRPTSPSHPTRRPEPAQRARGLLHRHRLVLGPRLDAHVWALCTIGRSPEWPQPRRNSGSQRRASSWPAQQGRTGENRAAGRPRGKAGLTLGSRGRRGGRGGARRRRRLGGGRGRSRARGGRSGRLGGRGRLDRGCCGRARRGSGARGRLDDLLRRRGGRGGRRAGRGGRGGLHGCARVGCGIARAWSGRGGVVGGRRGGDRGVGDGGLALDAAVQAGVLERARVVGRHAGRVDWGGRGAREGSGRGGGSAGEVVVRG